jgi:undecaprenyl-diphosphatase
MTLWQFDHALFAAVNGWAGTSQLLDRAVGFVVVSDLLKGILVMLAWWGMWFFTRDDQRRVRSGLIAVLICSVGAIFVGRSLAVLLPFRLRPLHDPAVDAVLPIGAAEGALGGWSSMPSDHAVLFFAMAVGMLLLNRGIGYVLLAHAVLVISLPRVFMALHYPSDIVFGALVGALIVAIVWAPVARWVARSRFFEYEERAGHLVYPVLFLVTYQAGTMFNSSRDALSVFAQLISYLVG